MRLLVIEDEHKIAGALKKGLEQEGYAVDVQYDGKLGLAFATTEEYDAIILDLMLPGLDGISVCREIRAKGISTPILMLTAKDQTHEKVVGLNHGADDYMVKPFSFEELLARIKALTRRPKEALRPVLGYEDLSLDTIGYSVKRAGTEIKLSAKEFALLEYLLHHPNQIVTRDRIINHIWDYDADVLPNTVEVYIGYLRNKIDKPFKKPFIHTVRGFGYRFGDTR